MTYHWWEGKSWSQINLFKEQTYEEQQSTLWAWWIRISGTIKVIRETSVVLLKHIPQFLPWRRTETGSVPTGCSYCTHTFNSLHTCNSCSRHHGWLKSQTASTQVHKTCQTESWLHVFKLIHMINGLYLYSTYLQYLNNTEDYIWNKSKRGSMCTDRDKLKKNDFKQLSNKDFMPACRRSVTSWGVPWES